MLNRNREKFGLNRTSARLSLQFAFLYAILSAVMFFGAYWMTNYEVRDWIEDQMKSDTVVLERIYAKRGIEELVDRVAVLSEFSFQNERIYQLRDADGKHLAGNVIDVEQTASLDYLPVEVVVMDEQPNSEILGYWIRTDLIGPYILVQGTGDHIIGEVMEALSVALVVGYIIVILAGLIIGISVGVRTERRIRKIIDTLQDVSEGELSQRIHIPATDVDDLSRVSGSINAMLDQLQTLLESQKQIATDIAHDLRTPLQRLRQRLERMIDTRAGDPDIQAALNETEDLIEAFKALLRIAQIESGVQKGHLVQMDLKTAVEDIVDIFQPVAEDKGQSLICCVPNEAVNIQGDPALLRQLLSNLIENAIRHCPSGSSFQVSLGSTATHVMLNVSDDGPGIHKGEVEKVFHRFYRIEKSRSTDGHGLGLPLVRAICQLHDARIELVDNAPGLNVSVIFPKPDPS